MADLLRARLFEQLGLRHGFNARHGGASAAPYASFNLGRSVGDVPEAVADNHRRFAAAVGYPDGALFELSQVHGDAVHVVEAGQAPAVVRKLEGDALVAPRGGIAVGVRTADCLPLLLADPASGAVAAVHAGWRGVVAGVVEAALSALQRHAVAESVAPVAAIFPHIGRCCFEVGDEVARQLVASSPDPDVVDRSRTRPHVDLAAIVGAKLAQRGVAAERIERIEGCTRCEPARFFSYRREGAASGRHVAAIVSAEGPCATPAP